jgi:hypothetical protein
LFYKLHTYLWFKSSRNTDIIVWLSSVQL